MGRVNYVSATDEEALVAFQLCSRLEGIIPALEPSHALAFTGTIIGEMNQDDIVILNMCGRGDKIWARCCRCWTNAACSRTPHPLSGISQRERLKNGTN